MKTWIILSVKPVSLICPCHKDHVSRCFILKALDNVAKMPILIYFWPHGHNTFLCLLENEISAQTGRTCKYFQLIPPFYWNGAIIIAKCALFLFIYSFFVELHLSRWNKWLTNHTQSANYTGKKTDCGVSNLQSLQVSDQTFSTDTLA